VTSPAQLSSLPVDADVLRIALAAALGMFLGLEREWSHKSAGIRTFALTGLLGAVFTILEQPLLLVLGGVLVIVQGGFLAIRGIIDEEQGLSLTTGVSMLVAYGVGALVAEGFVLEGVTVAVLSSLLLVLKRELHSFAWGLSRAELRSATEFAILAFVVYPLLPAEPIEVALGSLEIAVELPVVWLMVVTVAGIGIVNYAVVQAYGGRGIAVTGFFGGLASSAAVVGTMIDHVRQRPSAVSYAVAAIMLANAAMAVRNLLIAVAFTVERGVLVQSVLPLGAVIVVSVAIAAYAADWSEEIEMELETPFSMRNAFGFGAVFLVIVVAGGAAQAVFGTAGLYATAVITGLVSSAGATTSAVLLYRGGGIGGEATTIAILAATAASVGAKAALTLWGRNRTLTGRVTIWSAVVLVLASGVTAVVFL